MRLTVYRKYDLYSGLQLLVMLVALVVLGGGLALTGQWWIGAGAALVVVLAYYAPLRFRFRCPRCLARIHDEGLRYAGSGRWERMTVSRHNGDGEPPWSPEHCGVCGLDFTETTYEDWPEPVSLAEREEWRRRGRAAERARRPWWRRVF